MFTVKLVSLFGVCQTKCGQLMSDKENSLQKKKGAVEDTLAAVTSM